MSSAKGNEFLVGGGTALAYVKYSLGITFNLVVSGLRLWCRQYSLSDKNYLHLRMIGGANPCPPCSCAYIYDCDGNMLGKHYDTLCAYIVC